MTTSRRYLCHNTTSITNETSHMTFDYWCIFITFLLPYGLIVLAKAVSHFDNKAPRPFMENLEGWRKRAYWAHLNGLKHLLLLQLL